MRKIVICFDGTGDEIGAAETNVLRIYRSLDKDDGQCAHYVLGVGTADGMMVARRPSQKLMGVFGLAFGLGLEDDVLSAYRFLCRNWRAEEDRIYILGFSRGAYAARVLAGFIHNFGLVDPEVLHLIAPAFRAYRAVNDRDKNEPANIRYRTLRSFEQALDPVHPPIRALCLFDTVASIIRFGWPWHNLVNHQSLFELGTHANVADNASVRIVLHALAIDEHRTFFRALPWEAGRDYYGNRFKSPAAKRAQYLRQRWFPGFHGDIGGSPREDRAGLGKIAALWMLDALAEADREVDAAENEIRRGKGQDPLPPADPGLRLKRNFREVYFEGQEIAPFRPTNPGGYRWSGPDPRAPLHNSIFSAGWVPRLSWFWLILEVFPPKSITRREFKPVAWFRRGLLYYLPLLEPRPIPEADEVDESAFIRRDDSAMDYAPCNLTRPSPPGIGDG